MDPFPFPIPEGGCRLLTQSAFSVGPGAENGRGQRIKQPDTKNYIYCNLAHAFCQVRLSGPPPPGTPPLSSDGRAAFPAPVAGGLQALLRVRAQLGGGFHVGGFRHDADAAALFQGAQQQVPAAD